MLPDFPAIKKTVVKILKDKWEEARKRRLGPFIAIKNQRIHEGRGVFLVRDDGSVDDSPAQEIGVNVSMDFVEMESSTLEDSIRAMEQYGKELGDEQMKMMFEKMREVTTEVGNVTDLGGKPISTDAMFDMFEKIKMDFDGRGRPILAVTEGAEEQFQKVADEIQEDPVQRKRFQELMERKKEEWLEREASRKLVRESQ